MADSRKIVLGGKEFAITVPFTLEQLIACQVGMQMPVAAADDPKQQVRVSFDRAMNVIAAAVAEEHPEITVEYLRKMRGTSIREFNAATTVIYEECGLVVRSEGAALGEEQAEA